MTETTFVDVPGARLAVFLDGPAEAPALMFSNSLGAHAGMWEAQVAHLAARRRIIRYDVRGHGRSEAADGPYSIARLALDALAVLDHLAIGRTDWVGCSMGGMVGQWLLTHHRERIGRAVLANTSAFMGPPSTDWNARIRTARSEGMGPIAEAMKLRWFTKGFNESAPGEVARVTDMVREARGTGYASCAAAIRDMDQRESIRSVDNPVLVVVGAEDPATPPSAGRLIADRIRGAQLVSIPAAHISNCERPEEYNAAISAFLEG